MDAGQLNTFLIFLERGDADDGYGNPMPGGGEWQESFRDWAGVKARPGTTPIQGAAQVGVHPVVLTVRYSEATARLNNTFRIVMAETPDMPPLFIVSAIDADMSRRWITITATEGGAE